MSDGTIDQVSPMTRRLAGAAFAGSVGGLVFGYDLGALSSATQSLRNHFHLSPASLGLGISSSLWGTVCGALLAGRLVERFGCRTFLAGCALLYGSAAVAVTLPLGLQWHLVVTLRFLCGMAIGGITVGCPLYLSEIAPVSLRGRLVSLFQLQVGVGVVIAFCAASVFARLTEAAELWRWCFGTGAIPASALLLLVRWMPRDDRVGMANRASVAERLASPGTGGLFQRKNIRLIVLATSAALFNQLSGVNILLLYMLDVLSSAGIGLSLGHRYTVLISCLSLATTVLGMSLVDRAGRKPLLMYGAAGMALCLILLASAIPQHFDPKIYLLLLIAYNACFAFSQGTVVWVYLSELFPPGIRVTGQSYGSSMHWLANAILVSVFPIFHHASSVRIFYFFAAMMMMQLVIVWFWYPETRGTSLGSSL